MAPKRENIQLETYDEELAASRDTKQYRDKGKRRTTIKTVYGSVEYQRKVYKTLMENGETAYIYLLDEALQMDKIGLISDIHQSCRQAGNDSNRISLPCYSRCSITNNKLLIV